MTGISNHPDSEEEEKYLDHDKVGKEGRKGIRERI